MKLLPILILSAAMTAATARADEHGYGGGDHGGYGEHGDHGGGYHRGRPARARRSAPHPMRVGHDTHIRPAGAYRPPAVRFNLRGPARRGPVVWHAPVRNPVFGLAGFAAGLIAHEAVEAIVGRPYWHTVNGVRYAHYYDGHVHWYGFYDGPSFYWTRYDDGRWWWFDESHNRWLYWYGNYWWWHDPAHPAVPYVVIDDSYYPYSEVAADPQFAPGTTAPEAVTAPAAAPAESAPDAQNPAPPTAPPGVSAAPQSPDQQATADANNAQAELSKASRGDRHYVSPDKTREVRIMGAQREAFLYDLTGPEGTHFLAYLGTGVRHAEFSEASSGKLQVLLVMSDGSFDIFDANGHSIMQPAPGADNAAPNGAAEASPAPPAPAPGDNAPDGGSPTPPDGGAPPPNPPAPPVGQ